MVAAGSTSVPNVSLAPPIGDELMHAGLYWVQASLAWQLHDS